MSTTTDETPTVDLRTVRATLDQALVCLSDIEDSGIPLADAERTLGEALGCVYAAIADRGDVASFRTLTSLSLERVRAALGHLMTSPSDDAAVGRASALAARSIGELMRVEWTLMEDEWLPRRDQAPPWTPASVGLPRLIELSRAVIRPAVPLQAPVIRVPLPEPVEVLPAPPRSLEEIRQLAAETQQMLSEFMAAEDPALDEPARLPTASTFTVNVPEAERILFGDQLDLEALLRERARECMLDLAMMGRLRRATPPEPWASGEMFEQRLLAKLDGVVASGSDRFDELVRMLDDRPVPDAELTFGTVFLFGSIAYDDALDQVRRLLEVADLADPEIWTMACDALVFAPHPGIEGAAADWLVRPDPLFRALGAEVLRRRRAMTVAQVDTLGSDSDERVLAVAARALCTLPEPPPPGSLEWFLRRDEEAIVRAALESGYRLCRACAYERAAELCEEGRGAFADAAMFVAIGGGPDARALLEHEIATVGSTTGLRALGWFGDVTFAPFLLGRLRNGDDASKAAALDALERLTGASIVDAGIVPAYARDQAPFVREPMVYEPPGLLDGDADAWELWWKAWGPGAKEGVRYRFGQRFRLDALLHELTEDEFLQRDRPWASMELSARARTPPLLDWGDFVLRQREAVDALAKRVNRRNAEGYVRPLSTT